LFGAVRRARRTEMMSAKLVLALAAGGVGMLGVGAWGAHAQGRFGGHRDPLMMRKFIDFAVNEKLDAIGATDAQKQKVREVKDRLMKDGRALHESHAVLRDKVLALLAQDNPDAAQLKALIRERTDAVSRFGDEAADAIVEIHAVLTTEQRQKLLAGAREHLGEGRH
jgi:Spy/CpxP family protein refolding chaperone